MNDQNYSQNNIVDDSYVNNYQPPKDDAQPLDPPAQDSSPSQPSGQKASNNQTLESQNVFFLLGVDESQSEQKEAFLDELQQVIWEDFLESDVKLLITQDEYAQLEQIMAKTDLSEEDKQEEMVVFLEKLIPDLEEIMLEKAVELKGDMFKERIIGLKEYFSGQNDKLDQLAKAEDLVSQDMWYDAAAIINSLK